jgi:SAM-dependent methyltransferase
MARKAANSGRAAAGSAPAGTLTGAPAEYVLGANTAELDRLGLQHRLWSDAAHALWRRAGIRPAMAVLDAGCGPGFAAFDLAQIVGPAGRVVGVDQSPLFLDHLRAQAAARGLGHLRAVQADLTALAGNADLRREADAILPRPGFDLAYARWVLCFVSDPAAVVRGVASLLKPGARWCIQDYFNYESMCTAPRSPAFEKVARATGQAWRARGGDPDVMARVPALLADAGFHLEHLDVTQRLARPGDSMWAWPETFWTNFLPVLVESGFITEADRRAWLDEWAELSLNPGAFVVLPAVFDAIALRR